MPTSAIVAVARLVDCVRVESLEESPIGPYEHAFGNYEPGRWAWRLDDVRTLRQPVRCKGARGLWDVDATLAAAIEAHL
jgi:hypothetical protein